MKTQKPFWVLGLLGMALIIAVPMAYFWPRTPLSPDDPWTHVPDHPVHVDHKDILQGPFHAPQEVTAACLSCHPQAAEQVAHTTHWTWQSRPFTPPWRERPVSIGKLNQINNFCIGSQGNQKKCMSCHIGYAWEEGQPYDFQNLNRVDCLVCHADTALYAKGDYGNPAPDVDLLAAAQSVRAPTRQNCGKCHFDGGGGNGVKHGDLDESLYFPTENIDVHMGGLNFLCTDCHRTRNHQILGRLVADNYQIDPLEQVRCTDCHAATPHQDDRLNFHTRSVACQTCHIPAIALEDPTKVWWDWSTAGQGGRSDDHYLYLKIKGSFLYEKNYTPTYLWFNGNLSYRYLLGDKIDPTRPTILDLPAGDIHDPNARIMPFKLHIAKQPYDALYNILLPPRTAGSGGFWTTFDWPSALALGAQDAGLSFSGQYGFAETWMYWPSTHMVQPAANALQCNDCHSETGRLDWKSLGYVGDPMLWGGRFQPR